MRRAFVVMFLACTGAVIIGVTVAQTTEDPLVGKIAALLKRGDLKKAKTLCEPRELDVAWQKSAFAAIKKKFASDKEAFKNLLLLWSKMRFVVDDASTEMIERLYRSKEPAEIRAAAVLLADMYYCKGSEKMGDPKRKAMWDIVWSAIYDTEFEVRYAAACTNFFYPPSSGSSDPLVLLLSVSTYIEALKRGVDVENICTILPFIFVDGMVVDGKAFHLPRSEEVRKNPEIVKKFERWFFENWPYMRVGKHGWYVCQESKDARIPYAVYYQRASKEERERLNRKDPRQLGKRKKKAKQHKEK